MNIELSLREHYKESLNYFQRNNIFLLALQGSQNYNLHYEHSDVDTKLIVIPTLNDIVLNKRPVSTTHIRENDEHIDFKDIRLYFECFKKQNTNFLEILFTDYYLLNSDYAEEFEILRENKELIARLNPYRGVKSMKGQAMEKMHALERPYPSKTYEIETYGYDPKQLSHIVRISEFLTRFINGERYIDCLHSQQRDYILYIKKGNYSLEKAREIAATTMQRLTIIADEFCEKVENKENPQAVAVLEQVQYEVIKKSLTKEILLS